MARRLQAKNAGPENAAALPDLSAMSSLERVELLSDLENKYQVELDEDSFAKLASTRELEDWLRQPPAPVERRAETPLSEWARSRPLRWFRKAFQRFVARPLYRHYLPLMITGLENLNGLQKNLAPRSWIF